jgi:hypothetical protein
MTHIYTRHERRDRRRTPRCRSCARGETVDWPPQAVEPHTRGTWILQCRATGCTEHFTGRRQARYCERHRLNTISPRLRAKRRPSA